VSHFMIREKAKSYSNKLQYISAYSNISECKWGERWLNGFMRRYKLSNRRHTTVAQSNMTVEETGSRTVSIRTTGHEKSNFTVVLSCMVDGTKLPPLIIFKLVNVPRQTFPSRVVVRANREGYMNTKKCYDSVKQRFDEKNTNLAVIPGGLTSKLQPFDVSINKSFKSKKLTPTGQIQRPAYNLVTEWVLISWNQIDTSLIQRAFKCCGISNARDGSEDKYIFDYNWLNGNKNNGGNFIYTEDENENNEGNSENEEVSDIENNEASENNEEIINEDIESENNEEIINDDIEADKEINDETIDLTHGLDDNNYYDDKIDYINLWK
ncbi:3193_t:CDS:2, partial [Diversispora eburnea]